MIRLFTLLFAICMVAFISCSKNENPAEKIYQCDFSDRVLIYPFCSFAPKTSPEVNFPIRPLLDGKEFPFNEYTFEWSTGFSGHAVSVSYSSLPITVVITELATDCTAEATMDQDFWN